MHFYKGKHVDLRREYRKVFELSVIISLLLTITLFLIRPEVNITPPKLNPRKAQFRIQEVPQTMQKRPPPRPSVPVETENAVDPDLPVEPEQDIDDGYVFVPYDSPPAPVGGYSSIRRNLIYPQKALDAGIEGTVVIAVLIDKNGNAIKTEILKDSGKDVGFEQAAQKAVTAVKWHPAMQREHRVKIWLTIPIRFILKQQI
ncbi:TonB family protein [candidate division KSB1 bacterium]|nr:TonB family protein [candidate division KSB1 bacterium]NIR69445.1 TonB family protein [candidate division KSB1 bacterium]NIS22794.1 TonB family protein [candidate division KSB1 bacterium]NIT69634.1 TonB family protein [candidate division KSB1 bacterium]NIU23303.1 TonB family protein [candidate division KSB1 bacterium]